MDQKLENLEHFLLEFGTYASEKLAAAFFDKLPQPDIKYILSILKEYIDFEMNCSLSANIIVYHALPC